MRVNGTAFLNDIRFIKAKGITPQSSGFTTITILAHTDLVHLLSSITKISNFVNTYLITISFLFETILIQ